MTRTDTSRTFSGHGMGKRLSTSSTKTRRPKASPRVAPHNRHDACREGKRAAEDSGWRRHHGGTINGRDEGGSVPEFKHFVVDFYSYKNKGLSMSELSALGANSYSVST